MMPVEPAITAVKVAELLAYNPETGIVHWKVSRGPIAAGTVITGDYIKINGTSYVRARIIWCLHHGEWPPLDRLIDHNNRIHGDDKIDNLRLATPTQNAQNKAGYAGLPKGVYKRNRISKPWAARISVDGIYVELGSHATIEEAAEAYRRAAIKYHGEFACLI